jgi:hypothetical protein
VSSGISILAVALAIRSASMRAPAAMVAVPLIALAACASGPPAFEIEASIAVVRQPNVESLSIGSRSTPPPGEYRFARLYADGTTDVRELFTSNGPGPWLSLTGHVSAPQSTVQEALTAAAAPDSTSDDPRTPCVLAVDSRSTKWEGCAYPAIAARLLAVVPRLTMPDVAASCDLRVCQVRLMREVPPARHARYGDVQQDRLLDSTGALWCAIPADQPSSQIVTLRVERVRISEPDVLRVFRWVAGTIEPDGPLNESSPDRDLDQVMVRRRGGAWTRLAESDARGVRERWRQMAPRLPEACRSTP